MSRAACKEHANLTAFDFPIAALSTFHVEVTVQQQWENHLSPVHHDGDIRAAKVPLEMKSPLYTPGHFHTCTVMRTRKYYEQQSYQGL